MTPAEQAREIAENYRHCFSRSAANDLTISLAAEISIALTTIRRDTLEDAAARASDDAAGEDALRAAARRGGDRDSALVHGYAADFARSIATAIRARKGEGNAS